MKLLVYTVIGLIVFFVAYGLDLGSAVSALIFLAVILIGVLHRTTEPILAWVRG